MPNPNPATKGICRMTGSPCDVPNHWIGSPRLLTGLETEMLGCLEEAVADAEKCVNPGMRMVNYDRAKAVIHKAKTKE